MNENRYAKSRCFVLTPNGYDEISGAELELRKCTDSSYEGKRFITIQGMRMEVSEADYIDFHKTREHRKYMQKIEHQAGVLSLDANTDDECSQAELAEKYGLNQSNISRTISKILLKMRAMMER